MNSRGYVCGTPREECTGGAAGLNFNIRGGVAKIHSSTEEAFRCYSRHLMNHGFKRTGNREFTPDDGGPTRILTKKIRYGGMLRPGKRQDKGGKRFTVNDAALIF